MHEFKYTDYGSGSIYYFMVSKQCLLCDSEEADNGGLWVCPADTH